MTLSAPNLKPLAIQIHGFDSDVNQNFRPCVGDKRDRVPFSVDLSDFPVARRQDPVVDGVNGQPVAGDALGKDGIRHVAQRNDGTGQGGKKYRVHEG